MQKKNKNIVIKPLLSEIKKVTGILWSKGWAEANAGNFSVNITDFCKDIEIQISDSICQRFNKQYNYIGNNYILISSSGSRMRDIVENPLCGLCLLFIDSSGKQYYNIPLDNKTNKKPTSELLTHLEIQNLLSEINAKEKTVLHTHPAELIAITHLKKFKKENELNKMFQSVQPEVSILLPEGIGLVPYYKTGSEKLAIETKMKFNKYKIVLWEKHGCVSIGTNLESAFDKIDVLTKSVNIYFLCNSAGNKLEGINVNQIKELKNKTE
jgi:rhamnulose-1-phosphate aldolase